MSVQISDCTIRDGGYLLDKHIPEDVVKGIIRGLVESNIDYIETGFFQSNSMGESIVYLNESDVEKYLIPSTRSEFVGFCDNGRYSPDFLTECTGNSVKSFRISFAKHERKEALQFCKIAKEKNYHVFVQPMDALGYTLEEREELIEEVNKLNPTAFGIVDTFGIMHLSQLEKIFDQVHRLLDQNIKIGIHTHNNLQMATALVEYMIILADKVNRDVVVDSSLLGMGRGAGNACTEVVAFLINKKYGPKYDLPTLLMTVENYIEPIAQRIQWGYNLPMFLCGCESSHIDNIRFLQENSSLKVTEMYHIFRGMDLDEKKRYGENYSKEDFTNLIKNVQEYRRETK